MAMADKAEKNRTEEEQPRPEAGIVVKKKVLSCFKGVRLLQTLIILICSIVVIQQVLWFYKLLLFYRLTKTCVRKLIEIPVTTYTHFDFNKTIVYPSVTFCREPAYRYHTMLDHNLNTHPRFTSTWMNYNFSNSLDDLWDDITYTAQDMFMQYGLDGSADNVEIHPTTGFVFGRCYTMNPKTVAKRAAKEAGYSITLRHSSAEMGTLVDPPGYHVYVHYTREPFTEVEVYNGGLVQKLFMNVGETLEVKLSIDEYVKISDEDDPCMDQDNYSANNCTEQFVSDLVGQNAGCSGPWMSSDWPRCDNYTKMRTLISEYMNTYENHNCDSCPRFCRSFFYSCFVTDRQTLYTWDSKASTWILRSAQATYQTQLFMYFNSMMVSVYEERYTYDWNLFISDLGGSIGFLLGLSVIGLLKIMGKAWAHFIQPFVKKSRRGSITGSTATVDIATVDAKYFDIIGFEYIYRD